MTTKVWTADAPDYGWRTMQYYARIDRWVQQSQISRYQTIRKSLVDLQKRTTRHKEVIALALFLLKRRAYEQTSPLNAEPPDHHALTDHAFVRALQRVYGCNIPALKDFVLKDLLSKKQFEPIYSDDAAKIVTILARAA